MKGEILLRLWNGTGSYLVNSGLPLKIRLVEAGKYLEANLVAFRAIHEGFLVCFDGIESRELVSELVGKELHVARRGLKPLDDSEFFVEDIVGCEVFLEDGKKLGKVSGTYWNGAQDIMSVQGENGTEHLLPVIPEYVLRFEHEKRRLIVDFHE